MIIFGVEAKRPETPYPSLPLTASAARLVASSASVSATSARRSGRGPSTTQGGATPAASARPAPGTASDSARHKRTERGSWRRDSQKSPMAAGMSPGFGERPGAQEADGGVTGRDGVLRRQAVGAQATRPRRPSWQARGIATADARGGAAGKLTGRTRCRPLRHSGAVPQHSPRPGAMGRMASA